MGPIYREGWKKSDKLSWRRWALSSSTSEDRENVGMQSWQPDNLS